MNEHSSTISISSSLHEELKNLPKFTRNCCIYRVPRHLQMANEGSYTPLVVSIGPLHHHDDHLRPTELHKLKYLKSFLERSRKTGLSLDGYLNIIREHESQIRECYADPMVADVNSEDLIKMVLVDAAFLIELFSRNHNNKLINDDDQMFNAPRMVLEVRRDISLEENQLPFFILCDLYEAAHLNLDQNDPAFVDIACRFLQVASKPNPNDDSRMYKHLLDLLRIDFIPSEPRSTEATPNKTQEFVDQPNSCCFTWNVPRSYDNNKSITVCKTATALHKAGVKFIKGTEIDKLLDIKFDPEQGTLTIPLLVVQDDTEALFKNLAVFEHCHCYNDPYFINYILFLDFLISTPDDVALLVKQGIIENLLGSDESVADLVNGLSKHLRVTAANFYYFEQTKQLDEYYNRAWNRHLAVLRQNYFNHPWAIISVVYAIVLLILTVMQTTTGFIQIGPSKN